MDITLSPMITENFINELRFEQRRDALDAVAELLRRNRIYVDHQRLSRGQGGAVYQMQQELIQLTEDDERLLNGEYKEEETHAMDAHQSHSGYSNR